MGIRRSLGGAPRKKTALTAEMVRAVVRKIPNDVAGMRDRALIAIRFAGALHRSELVALDLADIERHPKGRTLAEIR
jgi:site-specific recombinase XerD